jgi:Sel1 repeat
VSAVQQSPPGLLIKVRAQGFKQQLLGAPHLWLPARLFPTEAVRRVIGQFIREKTERVIAGSLPPQAALRSAEPMPCTKPQDTGLYGRYLPEGSHRDPRRLALLAFRLGAYFLFYTLLHGTQVTGPRASDYNRGLQYLDGTLSVARDEVQAFIYFSRSASQGQSEATNMLGVLYQQGRGVPKDERRALQLFQEAAMKGSLAAQTNLARAYEMGVGTPQEDTRAVLWYRKAAEGGYAPAQDRLGRHYRTGQGVAQDNFEATDWFRRAAAQGNAPGQKDLADQYLEGHGVGEG